MRLDYVKNHPTTMMNFAVVAVTGAFLGRLTRSLTEAELELSVLKNRLNTDPAIDHLHDFTDANQCMLDALEVVFPETVEEGVDIQDPCVISIMDKVWENAQATLRQVYR